MLKKSFHMTVGAHIFLTIMKHLPVVVGRLWAGEWFDIGRGGLT